MEIKLIAVGTKMPNWVEIAVADYKKRLPSNLKLTIKAIAVAKRSSNTTPKKLKEQESQHILAAIAERDLVVALDAKGEIWSSNVLAQNLAAWQQNNHNVSLIIGGPDGLDDSVLQRANMVWSLSNLTLPHAMVRVVIAEQIYRASTILAGHPYHK